MNSSAANGLAVTDYVVVGTGLAGSVIAERLAPTPALVIWADEYSIAKNYTSPHADRYAVATPAFRAAPQTQSGERLCLRPT